MQDYFDFFSQPMVTDPSQVLRDQMRGVPTPAPAAPVKKVVKSSSISQTARNDSSDDREPVPAAGQQQLPRAIAAQQRPSGASQSGSGDILEDQRAELAKRMAKLQEEEAATFADPDYSKMSAYAKERSEQGQRDLMLAMAAGLGGEETKPLGAMFLKQASAAREPVKVATGLIDENGNYVEDAGLVSERKAKRIDARIRALDTLIASNVSAQTRRDAQQESNQLRATLAAVAAAASAGRQANNEPMVQVIDPASGDTVYMPRSKAEGMRAPLKAGATKDAAAADKAQLDRDETLRLLDIVSAVDPATGRSMIHKATSSGIGAIGDAANKLIGRDSESGNAAGQLKIIEGILISKVPKLSGPQSDKDAALYRQMAGQIGDPTVSVGQKEAAIETIRLINGAYNADGTPKNPNGAAIEPWKVGRQPAQRAASVPAAAAASPAPAAPAQPAPAQRSVLPRATGTDAAIQNFPINTVKTLPDGSTVIKFGPGPRDWRRN